MSPFLRLARLTKLDVGSAAYGLHWVLAGSQQHRAHLQDFLLQQKVRYLELQHQVFLHCQAMERLLGVDVEVHIYGVEEAVDTRI